MTEQLTYAYLGGITKSRDTAGFLHIKGLASDDTLDLDGQICDPEWLESSMGEWFKTGNLREMHGMTAVGKATGMSQSGTGFYIEGKIVDPLAATKTEEGVYGGLSIGIKGARVDRSKEALKRAPEGVIVGGRIVEVSLVDLPANPSAVLELVKTVGDVTTKTATLGEIDETPTEIVEDVVETPADDVEKRAFTDAERAAAASKGQAMPGGGFPIKTVADLKNAIQSVGRAKNPAAAKAHIKTRAKALGKESLIPDEWKGADADLTKADEMTHDPTELAAIRTGLINVIKAELDELGTGSDDEIPDLYQLLNSLGTFLSWWEDEADEGETTAPFPEDSGDDTMAYIGLGVSADLIKSATADDATDELKDELRTELRKALGVDDIATKTEVEELREANKSLEAELSTIREMAAPGQPALRATLEQQTKSAEADELETKAARYRATAYTQSDTRTLNEYLEAAGQLEKRAKELRASAPNF